MKRFFLFSIFGTLLMSQALAAAKNFASIQEASDTINQMFEENLATYAQIIRSRPNSSNDDASDEEFFVNRNCGPTSRAIIEDVRPYFVSAKIVDVGDFQGHVYIETIALIKNRKTKVIVDATYRQFYAVAAMKKYKEENRGRLPEGNVIEQQLLRAYPVRVLVVEAKNLRKTLENNPPFVPEWLSPNDYGPPFSTYKQYYRSY